MQHHLLVPSNQLLVLLPPHPCGPTALQLAAHDQLHHLAVLLLLAPPPQLQHQLLLLLLLPQPHRPHAPQPQHTPVLQALCWPPAAAASCIGFGPATLTAAAPAMQQDPTDTAQGRHGLASCAGAAGWVTAQCLALWEGTQRAQNLLGHHLMLLGLVDLLVSDAHCC